MVILSVNIYKSSFNFELEKREKMKFEEFPKILKDFIVVLDLKLFFQR